MRLKDDAPEWLRFLTRKIGIEDTHIAEWKGCLYTILKNTRDDYEVFIQGIQFPHYRPLPLVRALQEASLSEPVIRERRTPKHLYEHVQWSLADGDPAEKIGRGLADILNDACIQGDILRGVLAQNPLFDYEEEKGKPILQHYSYLKAMHPEAAKRISIRDGRAIPVFENGAADSWSKANQLARATIDIYLEHEPAIIAMLQQIDGHKIDIFKTRDIYERHFLLESWGWKFLSTTAQERRRYGKLPE